jgi:hypothetical protein
MPKTLDISAINGNGPSIVSCVAQKHKRVLLSFDGKVFGAIIPIEELRDYERLFEEEEEREDIKEARKRLKDPNDKEIPWEEVKREIEQDRQDAKEADRIIDRSTPNDFIPWDKAKKMFRRRKAA